MKKTSEIKTFANNIALNYKAFKMLSKEQPVIFIITAFHLIVSAISPFVTLYFSAQIINELATNRNPETLTKLILITLISAGMLMLTEAILSRIKASKEPTFYQRINKMYSEKFFSMDFESMDNQNTHDLYSQISQNNIFQGWGFFNILQYYSRLIKSTVTIISAITLTISLFTLPVTNKSLLLLNNGAVMLTICILMIVFILLSAFSSNKSMAYWGRSSDESKYGNRLFAFWGFEMTEKERATDVRIYSQEKIAYDYLNAKSSFGTDSQLAKWCKGGMGIYAGLSTVASVILIGIIYIFVCLKAWGGAFLIGSVTQYIGAITSLSTALISLVTVLGDINLNGQFLKTTFEFLEIPNNMYQGSLTTEKRRDKQYEIEFKNVSFKYSNTDHLVLKNVNMKFKVGQKMAIVGQNGSGKTTFIKLLCRLYDPTEGEILLNGIDIRKYNFDDYMSIFSVVFQDFKLLSYSLGENIAASINYDKELVENCLEKAGFSDRLKEMENGINTKLYKNLDKSGVEISGGEAQKIAIARAIYKNSAFIILDEPTASLDPLSESEIYSKFNEMVDDKTAIYISHRLSSCCFCDVISVFDDGKLVETGTHEKLLAKNGKYNELWSAQAQYYK